MTEFTVVNEFKQAALTRRELQRQNDIITKSLSTARAALARKKGFRAAMSRFFGVSK